MKKYHFEIYEHLMKKYVGLFGMGVKLPIRDIKALSLVYSPGVASSCLEIQPNIDNSYKYTNKLNSMLLVTDASAGNFKRDSWPDVAAVPYLEGISTIYKKLVNIDCYPLIIKQNEIKSGEELNDLINKIMPAYSAIEFYNMDPNLIKDFHKCREQTEKDIHEKNKSNPNTYLSHFFASVSSVDKHLLQAIHEEKKIPVNINLIYSAALRVALDTQSYINLNELIEELKVFVAKELTDPSSTRVYSTVERLISYCYDYLEKKNCINYDISKYYVKEFTLDKEAILHKYERFITEGENGWVCDFPNDYVTTKYDLNTNSLLLHLRHKGVTCSRTKIPFQSVEEMLRLLHFDNFEKITKKIQVNPMIAKELTTHGNLGAIITNGTAILGLGNIGALAGLPVMEGKSILFKLFGGVDIVPFCIDETDPKKLVRYCELISPIFSIINLEDIKSPECFYVEPELDKKADFAVFHDDQHGTAIVSLAGLINSLKLLNKKIEDIKVVMNGAGAAGLSVAQLLITYGVKHFIVCDTKGAIYKDRKENMNEFKAKMAAITNQDQVKGKLVDVIKDADLFIGLSQGGELTKDMVRSMAKDPIIFALANPIPEIYPHEAFEAGAAIVATGRSDFPNQINNSMAFPGIFRAAVDINASTITMSMKIAAAEGIAHSIPDTLLRKERIVPNSMDTLVAMTVAKSVAKVAEKEGLIRKKDVTAETVMENIDAWFHEGELRIKI